MRIVPFKIPKQIVLPGLVIQVHLAKPETPRKDGEPLMRGDADWEYDPATKRALIRIDQTLPIECQRYALLHELHHVIVDYLHCALKFHPDKVKVG